MEVLDGHRRLDVPLLVLLDVGAVQLLDHPGLGVQEVVDLLRSSKSFVWVIILAEWVAYRSSNTHAEDKA